MQETHARPADPPGRRRGRAVLRVLGCRAVVRRSVYGRLHRRHRAGHGGVLARDEAGPWGFSLGMSEAREAEAAARGAGRRPVRLPRIPLLLTAVRTTAADWETRG